MYGEADPRPIAAGWLKEVAVAFWALDDRNAVEQRDTYHRKVCQLQQPVSGRAGQ